MTTSAASAKFAPAPAAAPFTAEIVGILHSYIAINIGSYSSRKVLSRFRFAADPLSPRSWPEQNARPAPVRTRTRASASAARTACVISARICVLSAFTTSARRSSRTATPSVIVRSMVSYCMMPPRFFMRLTASHQLGKRNLASVLEQGLEPVFLSLRQPRYSGFLGVLTAP